MKVSVSPTDQGKELAGSRLSGAGLTKPDSLGRFALPENSEFGFMALNPG